MSPNPLQPVAILISILIIVALFLPQVKAQTTATVPSEIVVGPTSRPPSIDGQWQQDEWNNTIEYSFTLGSDQVKNRPTMRALHDNTTLYVLADVPSDNGSSWTSDNKQNWGSVLVALWAGSHDIIFLLMTDQTQKAYLLTGGVMSNLDASTRVTIDSHLFEATSLTTTIHSNMPHRLWEFSVRLVPYLVSDSLNNYVPPPPAPSGSFWSFCISINDGANHPMMLVKGTSCATATGANVVFASTPVPETISVEFMLPIVTLMSLTVFIVRSRSKTL